MLCILCSVAHVNGGNINEYEGLIEPFELVDVGTPVAGVVAGVEVKRSNMVDKGQPLVFLESSVESAVVERARVMVSVEGEIALQKERLAFANRMLARVEELFEGEAVSAEKHDKAVSEVILAQARLQKAMESREIARLDLSRAKAMLNQRTIRSPISGVVVERFVSPGEFVDNQPLLRLAQMDPLRVEVILPAKMFQKIQPGMQADIIPEIQKDKHYSSTVAIVDRVIDPASGTFGVRLELPNPELRLPSGLKCLVRFLSEQKQSSSEEEKPLPGDQIAKTSGRTTAATMQ